MKNSTKPERQLPGMPSARETTGQPFQSNKEGSELKKKLRITRSLKMADWGAQKKNSERVTKSRRQLPGMPSQSLKGGSELKRKLKRAGSLKIPDWGAEKKKSSEQKVNSRSPNYMKPTSSSDKRKEESLQVSTHVHTRSRIQSSIQLNYACKKNIMHGNHSKTQKKDVKSLARPFSLKARKPSMKATGVPLYLVQDASRATCSSTLKDSKFPDYVDLNTGGTESEGTSVMKVCPYTYCSLNGHVHKLLPPLKRFLSARRCLLNAQKSIKMRRITLRGVKHLVKGKTKIDTGPKLVPHLMQEADVISSPRLLNICDEQQIELLTGDWDDKFFVEICANSLPDITDSKRSENVGVIERSPLDQSTNEEIHLKDLRDPLVVAYHRVTSGFGQSADVETEEDYLEEAESVADGSCFELSLDDAEEDDNQQDQMTGSFFTDEETTNALLGAGYIDCHREEKDPPSYENNSSTQTAMASKILVEFELDEHELVSESSTIEIEENEASIDDGDPHRVVLDFESDLTSTTLNIMFTDEAVRDKEGIISSGIETQCGDSDKTGSYPAENSIDLSKSLEVDIPATPSGECNITKEVHTENESDEGKQVSECSAVETENDEASIDDSNPHRISLDDSDLMITNSISEMTFMAEAILCKEDTIYPGTKVPLEQSDKSDCFQAKYSDAFSARKIVILATPSDETDRTKEEEYTEKMEFLDHNIPAIECMDDKDDSKPDNGLSGDVSVTSGDKSNASNDTNDREKNLRDAQDVKAAPHDSQARPCVRKLEGISDGSQDDLAENQDMIACAPDSKTEFPKVNEDQRKINEPSDILENLVHGSVRLVSEAKEETFREDENLYYLTKHTEFLQPHVPKVNDKDCQDVLGHQNFQVESSNSVTDVENCEREIAEIQASQDGSTARPRVIWNTSYNSSEECVGKKEERASPVKGLFEKDAARQIKCAPDQYLEEPFLGHKAKQHPKDDNTFIIEKVSGPILTRRRSLKEITNFEGKDEMENTSKGEKLMMPETVLCLTRSYSDPKQIRNGRSNNIIEDKNEGGKFHPRGPRFLSIKPVPERDKVDLRHQMMDERKNAEEWMLDYALRKTVSRLFSTRKKKVALLVEAFETVMLPSKCEAHVNHASISFIHARTLQTCN